MCNLFGVIKQKNMYGKQVRGIERSTFVFDKRLAYSGANGAASKRTAMPEEVLDFVKTLN